MVIDPHQPGWTESTDAYGCIHWSPPPNPKHLSCGVAPRLPISDAEVPDDGAAGDSGEGGATDAVRDGATDGGDAG